MMKVLFFFMGVPMMCMSFFQVADAVGYAQSANVIVNGNEIVLSESEQKELRAQIEELFSHSFTVPALGVVTPEMYEEEIQNGIFVSLKFDAVVHVGDLPFDELVFKVEQNFQGFNLVRGNGGVYDGRCIFVNLDGCTTKALYDHIVSIPSVQEVLGGVIVD